MSLCRLLAGAGGGAVCVTVTGGLTLAVWFLFLRAFYRPGA